PEHPAGVGGANQGNPVWPAHRGRRRIGQRPDRVRACACQGRRSLRGVAAMMANVDWAMMLGATIDTLLMTGFSLLFTVIIGLPVGVLLFLTSPGQVIANRPVYQSVAFVVNVLRSVPFLILLIVMIPLSRVIVGTALGVQGSIPPLVASAAPFFARLVENVLRELDPG